MSKVICGFCAWSKSQPIQSQLFPTKQKSMAREQFESLTALVDESRVMPSRHRYHGLYERRKKPWVLHSLRCTLCQQRLQSLRREGRFFSFVEDSFRELTTWNRV